MRATIAYYDPPRRPAALERPDFTALPLTGKPVTISNMRAAGGGFSLDREGFTLASAPTRVRDFYDRDEVQRGLRRRGAGTGPRALRLRGDRAAQQPRGAGQRPGGRAPGRRHVHRGLRARGLQRAGRRGHAAPQPAAGRGGGAAARSAFLGLQRVARVLRAAAGRAARAVRRAVGRAAGQAVLRDHHEVGHWRTADLGKHHLLPQSGAPLVVLPGHDEGRGVRLPVVRLVHPEQVPHSAFVNESCPASAPPRASVEVRVFAFYAD